jgi:hypothetical protein
MMRITSMMRTGTRERRRRSSKRKQSCWEFCFYLFYSLNSKYCLFKQSNRLLWKLITI